EQRVVDEPLRLSELKLDIAVPNSPAPNTEVSLQDSTHYILESDKTNCISAFSRPPNFSPESLIVSLDVIIVVLFDCSLSILNLSDHQVCTATLAVEASLVSHIPIEVDVVGQQDYLAETVVGLPGSTHQFAN